jgi:hypothetical protein
LFWREKSLWMDLTEEIRDIWEQNKSDFEDRLRSWVCDLSCGNDVSALAKNEFYRPRSLRTYVSVSKSKSNLRAIYSLRFFGQEVAQLKVKNKKVILKLKGHEKKNNVWFDVKTEDGEYAWRGREAKEFRSCFNELAREKKGFPKVKSPEHRVEAKFIVEMRKGSGKFGVPGLEIQPVLIAKKFPLQIPLPISANTGRPKPRNGHIDILARRKAKDNKVRLSVWELKKENEYKHAAAQAYIYAYTLLLILRESKSKNEWYKLFGFKSAIPKSLTIEAVVAITIGKSQKFLEEKEELEKNRKFPFVFGNDRIDLYVAYYYEKANSIVLEENPFVEKP